MSKRKHAGNGSPDPSAMPLQGQEACTQHGQASITPSCTCGRCIDGWLSPNLAGLLCAAAEMERDQLLDAIHIAENEGHFGSAAQRKPLDLEEAPVFCPCLEILPGQVRRKQLHKTFLQGFAECFDTIAALLEEGCVPKPERVLCNWRSAHWSSAAQTFFCTRGGSVELALRYVVDHAPEVDEFYDSSQQPRCANDSNYERAGEELLGPEAAIGGRYSLLQQQQQRYWACPSSGAEESGSIGGGLGDESEGEEVGRGYNDDDGEWELGSGARRKQAKGSRAGLGGEGSSSNNWKAGKRGPGSMPKGREQLPSLHSRPPAGQASRAVATAAAGWARTQGTAARADGWGSQELGTPKISAQAAAALSPDLAKYQYQQQQLLRQRQLLQAQHQWQLQQQEQQRQWQQQWQQQGFGAANPMAAPMSSSGWAPVPVAPMLPPLVFPYGYAVAVDPAAGQGRAWGSGVDSRAAVGAEAGLMPYGVLAGMHPLLHQAWLTAQLTATTAGPAGTGQARYGAAPAAPVEAAQRATAPPHLQQQQQQQAGFAGGAVWGGRPVPLYQAWAQQHSGAAAEGGVMREWQQGGATCQEPAGQQILESAVAARRQPGAPPVFAAAGGGGAQAPTGLPITTSSALATQQQQQQQQREEQPIMHRRHQLHGTPAQGAGEGGRISRHLLLDALGLAARQPAVNPAQHLELLLGLLQEGGKREPSSTPTR